MIIWHSFFTAQEDTKLSIFVVLRFCRFSRRWAISLNVDLGISQKSFRMSCYTVAGYTQEFGLGILCWNRTPLKCSKSMEQYNL